MNDKRIKKEREKKSNSKVKKRSNNSKKIRIKEENDIPKTTILTEEEEEKLRKRTKKIFNIIVFLILLVLLLTLVDYIRFKQNKDPIFAMTVFKDDSTIKEYYGLGYKIIEINSGKENKSMKFGSWFIKVNDYDIATLEYNKTREINVEKLKILEDLTYITNKEKDIPKNPDEYIKKNKDKYNQIKEMESGYKYFVELIIHSESATQFDKYLLARMINEKNDKIDFKFKTAKEFIKQYEEYLSKINIDELDDNDLDKIAYDIIFGNPYIY